MIPNQPPAPSCSPIRALRALFAKLRAAYGARVEYEVAEVEIARESSELAAADREAVELEAGLDRARTLLDTALCSKRHPGMITQAEARPIIRELLKDTALAHRHETHLRHLSE